MQTSTRLIDFVDRGLSYTQMCRNGRGDVEYILLDRDGDGYLSAGDQVTLEYLDSCEQRRSNSLITGSVTVEVSELDRTTGVSLRARATFPTSMEHTSIRGRQEFDGMIDIYAFKSGNTEIVDVSLAPNTDMSINYSDVGATENVSDFSFRRELRPTLTGTGRFDISTSFSLESGQLQGRVDCQTDLPLQGDYSESPDSGALRCEGAGNSLVHIAGQQGNLANRFLLEVDPEGDNTFVQIPPSTDNENRWHDNGYIHVYTEEIYGQPGNFSGPDQVPLVPSTALAYDIVDAVYAAHSGTIYVATPSRIAVLDAVTMLETDSFPLPFAPSAIALAEDSSMLWVGYPDRAEVQSINLSDGQVSAPVSIASPPPIVDPMQPFTRSLAVAPGNPDLIVINVGGRSELIAINNGAQLPLSIGTGSNSEFSFVGSSTIAMDMDISPRFWDVSIVDVDPVIGLQIAGTIPDVLRNELPNMFSDGLHAISGSGLIYDTTTFSQKGRLPKDFDINSSAVRPSPDHSMLYTYGVNNTVSIISAHPYQLQGTYKFEQPANGAFVDLLVTVDDVIGVFTGQFVRISRTDLVPNLPVAPCIESDLSGVLVEETLFKIDCRISDAVFDSMRNQVLAGVLGREGPGGNSVIFIDPNTGLITGAIPIGGSPERLVLSDDGTTVYVTVNESSEAVVIDLNSVAITGSLVFGAQQDGSGNDLGLYFPTAVDAASGNANDVLVSFTNGDIAFFPDRTRAASISNVPDGATNVFLSQSADRALILSSTSSEIHDVSAAGTVASTVLTNALADDGASRIDNEVFLANGEVFDISQIVSDSTCSFPVGFVFGEAVAFDVAANSIIQVSGAPSAWTLRQCDRVSGAVLVAPPITVSQSVTQTFVVILVLPGNRLGIVRDSGIMILDSPF